MQDSHMTPIQAVLHSGMPRSGRDRHVWTFEAHGSSSNVDVDFVPNPHSRTPWQIAAEIPGGHVPDLSSPDFLRLATLARTLKLSVLRFQLVDRRFDLIPSPEQERISAALVEQFDEGGAYAVQLALRTEFPDAFLNGIEVYAGNGVRFDVRRDGVLHSNDQSRVEEFFRMAVEELEIA